MGNPVVTLRDLDNKHVNVNVINILGKEVATIYSGLIENKNQQIKDIDLNHLAKGVYFINVISEGKAILTDKLILR